MGAVAFSTREIKTIDPHMQQLDLNQRMHLLTHSHILELNERIFALEGQIEGQRIELEARKTAELKQKQREGVFSIAFGAEKWNKYFGDIGVEPPLPPNIEYVLNSPCLFWPDKKVRDTHLLFLVPATVDGKPLTLNSLQELIQKPKEGYKTQYRYYNDFIKNELGNQSTSSHWVLMTRDVIPGSRSKPYEDQKKLVATHAKNSGQPYELPKALDVTIGILIEHVQTATKLYNDNPWAYNRCQEKVNKNQWPVAIGDFGAKGLRFDCDDFGSVDYYAGVGGSWKF